MHNVTYKCCISYESLKCQDSENVWLWAPKTKLENWVKLAFQSKQFESQSVFRHMTLYWFAIVLWCCIVSFVLFFRKSSRKLWCGMCSSITDWQIRKMSKVCASRVPLIGYEGRKETMAAIEECGLQLMDHPLFSSDLAPSYFFLFP